MAMYRVIDIDVMAMPNLTAEMKLVLAEVLSWCEYYRKRQLSYRFNPAQIAGATAIRIDYVINMLVRLVDAGILSVGECGGFSTLSPTYGNEETKRLLSILK